MTVQARREHLPAILLIGCDGFIGYHLAERLLAERYREMRMDSFDPFYVRRLKEPGVALLRAYPRFFLAELVYPAAWFRREDKLAQLKWLEARNAYSQPPCPAPGFLRAGAAKIGSGLWRGP